ncbi:Glycosyltransferase involved in cell wall bisynthesis [Pedobacter westerhofensis]|uniref:Glycosyltransferase involved in cell wall bisynthesis n=1 Tax=Pedobacter westerhofensis TaxID=425512 RepID=A0A521C8R6_9SPHI|nr:Glycosyltransferase involved in cell wall bisynthesis [Pedobacter westerhofensis]
MTQKLTGVQRFAFEMVKGLLDIYKGEIKILIPPRDIDSSYDVADWPIKVIGKLTNTLWEQIDLPLFLIKNNKPLLISLVNTAPCFYKRQIVSILDMTTFVNPAWFSFKFAHYYKLVVPLIAKNSLKIITISEHSKSDIIKFINIPSEKVEVLHCAVSDKFINKPNMEIAQKDFFNKKGLTVGQYILGVSSLDPRKNFQSLIEAFLTINTRLPLVIVGSKGKAFADNNLKSLISDHDNIVFTGYVEDSELIQLYQSATCFVYPSLYEGFGMPPLEAMACGCPTIVSNTSSLPEVCGDASLYVNPTDIKGIKETIELAISDDPLRKSLTEKGDRRYKKFSWESSCYKLNDIIIQNLI